jgi:hypothetical protein
MSRFKVGDKVVVISTVKHFYGRSREIIKIDEKGYYTKALDRSGVVYGSPRPEEDFIEKEIWDSDLYQAMKEND